MNYRRGKAGTSTYHVWASMIARCNNPNSPAYENYGGRGISVCDAWKTFAGFYADMGDRPAGLTLERVNNSLGYCPENCRWVTRSAQGRNKRSTRLITAQGVTLSMAEWSERSGLKLSTIWARIDKGWPEHVAVQEPLISKRQGVPRGSRLYCAERGVKVFDAEDRGARQLAPRREPLALPAPKTEAA